MSPLTVPRAKNEGDALGGLAAAVASWYTSTVHIKDITRALLRPSPASLLEIHPWTLNGAIKCVVSIFSSKMCCLLEHVCRGRSTEFQFVVLMGGARSIITDCYFFYSTTKTITDLLLT